MHGPIDPVVVPFRYLRVGTKSRIHRPVLVGVRMEVCAEGSGRLFVGGVIAKVVTLCSVAELGPVLILMFVGATHAQMSHGIQVVLLPPCA